MTKRRDERKKDRRFDRRASHLRRGSIDEEDTGGVATERVANESNKFP